MKKSIKVAGRPLSMRDLKKSEVKNVTGGVIGPNMNHFVNPPTH